MLRVLCLQGALGGSRGNTAVLVERARAALEPRVAVDSIDLTSPWTFADLSPRIADAQAFVFATGTYWDGPSSALQRFFEEATPTEATTLWLGKPALVLVTMHSIGGKEVASRLASVLTTFGAFVPPMGLVVCSQVNEMARRGGSADGDLFGPSDVDVAAHNLLCALGIERSYRAWDVDRGDPSPRWL